MGEKKELQKKELEISRGRVLIDHLRYPQQKIVLGPDENLTIFLLPSRGSFSKKLDVFLRGDRSRLVVLGVVLGARQEESTLIINTIHQGRGTSAYTHVRAVLFDASETHFSGLIKIEKGADQTSSLLENRVLLLGPKSRAESIPSLEIEANEVKASHAATTGQIDEQQLFYLRSRGIDLKTATRMIVEGFFEPIFDRLREMAKPAEYAHIRGALWANLLAAKL